MVVVVTHAILEPSGRAGGLNPPDEPLVGKSTECVVHRLSRNRTDLATNGFGEFLGGRVGAGGHSIHDGQTLRSDVQTSASELLFLLGCITHELTLSHNFWTQSRFGLEAERPTPYVDPDERANTPMPRRPAGSTLKQLATDGVALVPEFPIVTLFVAAGVAGFACYAASFALVQIGRLDGNSITYTLTNMAAAAFVLVSMVEQFNLGSLLTQVTWIGTGVVGVYRRRQSLRSPSATAVVPQHLTPEGQPA